MHGLQVMELCGERWGELLEHTMLTSLGPSATTPTTDSDADNPAAAGGGGGESGRCLLRYVLPLSELAGNLYSQIKARTQGWVPCSTSLRTPGEPGEHTL